MCVFDQSRVGRQQVDDGEKEGGGAETPQDAEPGAEPRKQEKLDDAACDAVHGVDGADLVGTQTEAAGEFEGEVRVGWGPVDARVVEEDGEDLVEGYRVEGEKGVRG